MEPETRFELVTTALRKQSSTTELLWLASARRADRSSFRRSAAAASLR